MTAHAPRTLSPPARARTPSPCPPPPSGCAHPRARAGLIEKKSKNNIQWNSRGLGLSTSGELKGELDEMKAAISQLEGQEMMLDDYIALMQNTLRELSEDESNAA